MVLEGEKAGEGLGADLGNALLVNLLDRAAIHDDADPWPHQSDLKLVPLPGRPDRVFARRDIPVERAGGMGRRRAPGIVEKLELVAAEARPRRPRAAPVEGAGAHSDAGVAGLAVGFLSEPKLHPQRDVGKRLAGVAEEAEAETVAVDLPLLDAPHRATVGMDFRVGVGFNHPAIEIPAVEDRLKAFFGSAEQRWQAEDEKRGQRGQSDRDQRAIFPPAPHRSPPRRGRSASTPMTAAMKAGRSDGRRLETKCRSTTTSASSNSAPALTRSSLMPGLPVTRTPR